MNLLIRARKADHAIREISADWVARSNGQLSPIEVAELQAWLAADPRHANAFAEAQAMWTTLNRPRKSKSAQPVLQALARAQRQRIHRFKVRTLTAATFTAAAVFAIGLFPRDSRSVDPGLPTVTLSPDRQSLPDGSVAELNAGAEIAVAYTVGERSIRLVKGEVLFTVATNAARPFVVAVGDIEVRALGTAFSVCAKPELIDVLVTEGRVAVERLPSAEPGERGVRPTVRALELSAGNKAAIPVARAFTPEWNVRTLGATEIKAALAWRDKRFEFTETPMNEAIQLFNRQNRLQISLGDHSLKERRITGVFWSDDPEGLVRLLEAGLTLQAERSSDLVVLRKQKSAH